eukprot:scaffold1987_cov72-Isochrysis_galbana.AAC.2
MAERAGRSSNRRTWGREGRGRMPRRLRGEAALRAGARSWVAKYDGEGGKGGELEHVGLDSCCGVAVGGKAFASVTPDHGVAKRFAPPPPPTFCVIRLASVHIWPAIKSTSSCTNSHATPSPRHCSEHACSTTSSAPLASPPAAPPAVAAAAAVCPSTNPVAAAGAPAVACGAAVAGWGWLLVLAPGNRRHSTAAPSGLKVYTSTKRRQTSCPPGRGGGSEGETGGHTPAPATPPLPPLGPPVPSPPVWKASASVASPLARPAA